MSDHVLTLRNNTMSHRVAAAPFHAHRLLRCALCAAGCCIALVLFSQHAWADVQTDGDVLVSDGGTGTVHGDNPFTLSVNEGIPKQGNSLDPFEAFAQTNFEGRPDTNPITGITTSNINFDVYVGRSSVGQMLISGGSDLRDMTLIIGDSAVVAGQPRRGTGTVRIEGFGSLYNNDPTIIPFLPPPFDPDNPISPSVKSRASEAGAQKGFDMYVGRNGTGTLEIALGGRAEIQDAVIVGDQNSSIGQMIIDGLDSVLQSGGFKTTNTNNGEIHQMIIGHFGSGTMSVKNGGQVTSQGPFQAQNQNFTVAAIIGSDQAYQTNVLPNPAGVGVATIDGDSSKWIVQGTLQIGGFDDSVDALGNEDLSGINVRYQPNVGRGTLNVTNTGLVSVVAPASTDAANPIPPNQVDVVIGRFGTLNLGTGGRVEIQGVNTAPQNGGPTTPLLRRGRVINDGLISGSGTINVQQFRNRVLGEVRASAGDKLFFSAAGAFNPAATNPPDEYPLSNYGLIEALGTQNARAQIEFDRGPAQPAPVVPAKPFLNLQAGGTGGNGRTEGEIVGQFATFRFRSGIINNAKVLFTAGDNVVGGTFTNGPTGELFVSGNGTTVTFEDEFINNGFLELAPNISLISFLQSFAQSGSGGLGLTVGGRPTGQEISRITAAGNLNLDGLLDVGLFNSPGQTVTPFTPQIGDAFEIMGAGGIRIGTFSSLILPFLGIDRGFIVDYGIDDVVLRILGTAASIGADINGDGIVDDTDLQIIIGNLGHPGGLGDVNGDGVVNGFDYFLWQQQVGGPGVPGAGAGGGLGGTAAVPEPASIALLAIGGVLALAIRRRRS